MTDESIGSRGTAGRYGDQAKAELRLGMACLREFVGPPPDGYRLVIQEHEHDLGIYATIVLRCAVGSFDDAGWAYYGRCEKALSAFDEKTEWRDLWDVVIEYPESEFEDDDDEE